MQPITLTFHIDPAAAVRDGYAQAGEVKYTITESELGQLTETQRDVLARHLAGEPDYRASLGKNLKLSHADFDVVRKCLDQRTADIQAEKVEIDRKKAKAKEWWQSEMDRLRSVPIEDLFRFDTTPMLLRHSVRAPETELVPYFNKYGSGSWDVFTYKYLNRTEEAAKYVEEKRRQEREREEQRKAGDEKRRQEREREAQEQEALIRKWGGVEEFERYEADMMSGNEVDRYLEMELLELLGDSISSLPDAAELSTGRTETCPKEKWVAWKKVRDTVAKLPEKYEATAALRRTYRDATEEDDPDEVDSDNEVPDGYCVRIMADIAGVRTSVDRVI